MSRGLPRAVLDTNLVLSALVFQQGRLASLRTLWLAEQFNPLVSRITVAELIRVLAYPKFRLTAADQEELLADYLPYCTTVSISNPPPATPDCRDPADIPFLQLALDGKADFLVTGDKDLLVLSDVFICQILSAGAFLAKFPPH